MNLTKLLLICYTIVPLAVAAAAAWSGCPPDGPLLPRPTNIHNSAIVANATSKLSDLLDKALNGSIESGFSVRNTSFSVGVVSLDSPSGLPFWSYHHRGQGNTSRAVIPPVENSWGSNYGDNAPGGGLFSSLNDLSILLHSILDRTASATDADIRAWLKPHSSTSSPSSLVGRPWEIFRAQNLTEYPHTTDVCAKNGGAYGYTAQVAVIDQYGIGIVVLTAGPPESWSILYDAILSTIVPAVDKEARHQAKQYLGTWEGKDSTNTSVQLQLDLDDGPRLILSNLTRNGSDVLSAIAQAYTLALPQFGSLESSSFRIFPADLSTTSTAVLGNGTMRNVTKEDWRINLDFKPSSVGTGSQLPGQGLRDGECTAWQTADWFYYGGEAADRIVVLKEEGRGVDVEVPFLRAVLDGRII